MRNLRLTLAYDGTHYLGWQVQPQGATIQSCVEAAILKLTGETVSVLSAGRTDSGVHALGQVASFHTNSNIPASNWAAALQTCLPPDIQVLDAAEVPPEFHATFSARRKRYRYVIHNGPVPLPFLQNYVYHIRRILDVEAMNKAAQSLLGTHDFRSFETDWPNKATSVRTVFELTVQRTAGWPVWAPPAGVNPHRTGTYVTLDIVADGFLYNMVRSITGTLINVGRGRWTANDVQRILEARDRTAAGSTAPASGLYLVEVEYATAQAGRLSNTCQNVDGVP